MSKSEGEVMNLYEIIEEFKIIDAQLDNQFNADTGEIEDEAKVDELLEAGERINDLLRSKTTSMIQYVKTLESNLMAIEIERKRLQEREKQAKNKLDKLKEFIKYALENQQLDKVECEIGTIRLHKSQSVKIINESAIPEDYKTVVEEVKVDKKELAKFLKANGNTEWAEMQINHSVVIK